MTSPSVAPDPAPGADGSPPRPCDRAAGVALVLGGAAAAFLLFHHPHGPHGAGDDARAAFAGVVALAGAIRWVHGALLGVLVVLAFGHAGLAAALGLRASAVRLGLVAYAAGAGALGLAGVLNGVVLPAFAAHYAEASAADARTAHVVAHYGFELNQALAAGGLVLTSLAIGAWSWAALRWGGAWRALGAAGVALGLACAALVLGGHVAMDVAGFGGLMTAQAVWAVAAGLCLSRPRRA